MSRMQGGAIAAIVALAIGCVVGYLIGRSHGTVAAETSTKQLWTCSMHPQVLQEKPGTCPICGMALTPVRQSGGGKAEPGERKVKYWWDSMMNPPYISDKPGKSPMGMDLVPVYEDEVHAGPTVTIDPVMTQNIGMRVSPVEEGPLNLSMRTVGYLREAETHQHDITLKVEGWIERLHANTEGMSLKKGDPLFELYSPEILVAQEELLLAHRALAKLPAHADADLRQESTRLLEGARKKLMLWNVPNQEIEETLRSGKAAGTVTFRSPADGYVAEKMVVQGAAVESRMKLLRIIDPAVLWIDAQIYESQLAHVKTGLKARALLRASSNRPIEGEVIFVSPQINPQTRAATARIALQNPDLALKPGQFATVEFSVEVSPRALLIPREAIIDTGIRQIAFVALPGGHFEPRLVRMGVETGDGRAQVLSGLAPGESVVISGQFLLDSESRLREAIEKMTAEKLQKPAKPPAPSPGGQGHSKARSDPLLTPYFEISDVLSKDRVAPNSSVDALVDASKKLIAEAEGAKGLVEAVEQRAAVLRDKPLKEQREAFKKVSESVIELLGRVPPSTSLGPKVFVIHCPMAEASWVQKSDEIANPYYGSEMLECGTVTATVPTVQP